MGSLDFWLTLGQYLLAAAVGLLGVLLTVHPAPTRRAKAGYIISFVVLSAIGVALAWKQASRNEAAQNRAETAQKQVFDLQKSTDAKVTAMRTQFASLQREIERLTALPPSASRANELSNLHRKIAAIEAPQGAKATPRPTISVCVDGQPAGDSYQTYLNLTTDSTVQDAAYRFDFDKPIIGAEVGSSTMATSYGHQLIGDRAFSFSLSMPQIWEPNRELQITVTSREPVIVVRAQGSKNENFRFSHKHPCPDLRKGPIN